MESSAERPYIHIRMRNQKPCSLCPLEDYRQECASEDQWVWFWSADKDWEVGMEMKAWGLGEWLVLPPCDNDSGNLESCDHLLS